jgi:hypothetical protein
MSVIVEENAYLDNVGTLSILSASTYNLIPFSLVCINDYCETFVPSIPFLGNGV